MRAFSRRFFGVLAAVGLGCAPDFPATRANPWVPVAIEGFVMEPSDLRLEPLFEASERRVVFRYRSYVGLRPAHVSAGTTSLVHDEPGDVVRFVRGDGLQDALVTRFDDRSYVGDEALPPLPDGVTLSAWLRTDAAGGTVFSTDDGTGGLELGLVGGVLHASWSVLGAAGSVVTHGIADASPMSAGWTSVVMRLALVGDDVQVRLYRDDRLVAEDLEPALAGVVVGAGHPTVGAALDGTAPFAGWIEAVEVRDWPVDHDVLATPQLRDGGCALGRPCFHDSLDDTDILARIEQTDRRYVDDGLAVVRLSVPFLDDHYTPQGLEVSEDGRRLYLSAYWDDTAGNLLDRPSVVIEVDLEQARTTRLFRLFEDGSPLALHVGGVGVLGRTLYVPSPYVLRLFDLDDAVVVQPADERGTPEILDLEVAIRYETASWGSFLEVDPAAGALWIGQFVYPGNGTGWLDRYDVDAQGRLARTCSAAPEARVVLPLAEIQGAWPRMRDGGLEVLLTSSSYDRPSQILRWTPGQVPVVIARLPAGIEEVDVGPDGTVWTWFESASRKYQVDDPSAPWSDVYPYIVGFDADALGTR